MLLLLVYFNRSLSITTLPRSRSRTERRESAGEGLVAYDKITDADYENNLLHDYDKGGAVKQDLGYLALATDDTPWSLRITDVSFDRATYGDAIGYTRRDTVTVLPSSSLALPVAACMYSCP